MSNKNFTGTNWISIPVYLRNREKIIEDISEEDLSKDTLITHGNPIETESHITLLMGIPVEKCDSVADEKIRQFISSENPPVLYVKSFSKFSNPDKIFEDGSHHSWEVVYAEIDEKSVDILKTYQKFFENLFDVRWHFPEFKPHITIAYLKYGTADKYLKRWIEKYTPRYRLVPLCGN